MRESIMAVGTEEEGVMEMNTIDLIIVQVLEEEEVDSITRRRAMGEVAIIITTAIVEEGEETITMTITPWRKDIVIDRLTTTSLHMGTIASITIAAVGMRGIIESSIA